MTPAERLLAELRRRGIEPVLDGDRLGLRAQRGALTPELLDALRTHKAELLESLRAVRERKQAAGDPKDSDQAYSILVDGVPVAGAGSMEKALEALDAVVRTTPLQPGRRTRIELRDGKGKALRTCYLPTRETLTTLKSPAGSDEGRAAAQPRGEDGVEVVERR